MKVIYRNKVTHKSKQKQKGKKEFAKLFVLIDNMTNDNIFQIIEIESNRMEPKHIEEVHENASEEDEEGNSTLMDLLLAEEEKAEPTPRGPKVYLSCPLILCAHAL